MVERITLQEFETFEKRLNNLKVLVVGDCMLDRYFRGEVTRISPEAPVPVFDLRSIYYSLGGAANVAANLRGLKVQTKLMGVVGPDKKGEILKKLASDQGIEVEGVVEDPERPTTVKTRIIAQSQQLLRIDFEKRDPLNPELLNKLKNLYEKFLSEVDGVILSDYAKGVLVCEEFCNWLIKEARQKNKFVFVDPKSFDWKKYAQATAITPNLKEFKQTMIRENLDSKGFEFSAKFLIEKYGLDFLVVTLGKEGMFLYHPDKGGIHLPAQAKEVYDVSGAGDTAIATLAAFYGIDLPLELVVELANIAAGIVVGKVGTKPVYLEEIKNFFIK